MSSDVVADGTQSLSTAPAPVEAGGPQRGAVVALRRAWRQLTSMRTALLLLFLLAVASIPGSVLPQRNLAPSKVAAYFQAHPALAPLMDRLSLFDVFHAPWYAAIYSLLFISLIGCILPRSRLHLRALRARPPLAPARLGRLPEHAAWRTSVDVEQVVSGAQRSLQRGRWRVQRDGYSVAAEKGYLRETGNLLFHVALVVLMVGVALGSLFGYQGDRLLVQGQPFTNAVPLYDQYSPGGLVTAASLQPFGFTLERFTATYQPTGQPKTFDALVSTTAHPGGPARLVDLQVNHPLRYGNANVYLLGHGYALHVILRDRTGKVWFNDEVPCIPLDLTDYLSQCVIKAPDTGATVTAADGAVQPLQFGAIANLAPTAAFDPARGVVSTFPALRRPRVLLSAFTGSLGLDSGTPSSVYSLNTTGMHKAADAVLTPGATGVAPSEPTAASVTATGPPQGTVVLPHGFTLQVQGVTNWASFQVKDDPGKAITLVAAALIVLGLVLSLRIRRRRLWLRATPQANGLTLVEVGGLARTDTDGFAVQFPDVLARLTSVAPPLTAVAPSAAAVAGRQRPTQEE